MTIWYTSDTHFGHGRILELCGRPFKNITHMNEMLVHNWNSVVSDTDTVYHLGDVALGSIDDSLKYILRLNGEKFLVPGNHDRCWSGSKNRPIDRDRYTDVGFTILPEQTRSSNGWRVSHLPYTGDSHHDDRYADMRPKPNYSGEWLVCGHVHEHWKIKDHQINVGVDVWDFKPVSEQQIWDIMDDSDDDDRL